MSISTVEDNKSSNFPYELTELNGIIDILNNIEKTDDDGVVQIYSYKHCNLSSPDVLKKCRGLVFQGETRLFQSIGFTPEYNEMDQSFTDTVNMEDVTFYRSEEGTLIRVFYANGRWYVSTNRKLDSFKSRWGSNISFGEIFEKALLNNSPSFSSVSSLTDNLNQENVYMFLIRNISDNRLVSRAPQKETVFHVGTLLGGSIFRDDVSIGVTKQSALLMSNMSDVIEYVKNVDPFDHQGVIGFHKDGTQFKIVNSKYQLYSNVRGNEASIPFRYLQIRTNPVYAQMLGELYPEKIVHFGNYENVIFNIAKSIHFSYMERFINKKEVVVPKEEYRIIRECHGWHITDRQNHKVTLNVVLSILSHPRFASTLNIIIKRTVL